MIIITGATGALGSRIVDRLLGRLPATEVGVSVRDPDRAAHLADRGVRVRRGDFTDPETLGNAFPGADRVLVISASLHGDAAIRANAAAIDAAREAGAQRILYTSHQAASKDSLFPAQPVHAASEEHLARQGLPFTALRNGYYASALGMFIGEALETGELVAPDDGPFSWTAHDDLAEAAVVALTDDGALDGVSPPLTAPAMFDLEAIAGIIGDISGQRVTRVVIDDDEWKKKRVESGVPEWLAEFFLGMFRAARNGEFAVTDPALETIIGRPATPVRAVLEHILAER